MLRLVTAPVFTEAPEGTLIFEGSVSTSWRRAQGGAVTDV